MTSKLTCESPKLDQWRLRSCIPRNDVKSIRNKDTTRFVTFSNSVKGIMIPSWRDFSLQEAADYWLSEEEYARIKHKMRKEIAMLEKGEILHDKKYCSRGLEQYLKKNAISRAANIQQGVSSVLKEQYDVQQMTQRDFESDDVRIAKAYEGVSSGCRTWASVIGLRDMRDAEKYLEDILEWPSEYPSRRSICCTEEKHQAAKALLQNELVPRTA
eukprot:scaffold1736_cov127-Cylindrotheca_fusiformis.AAC.3